MTQPKSKLSRRDFLVVAGAGSVATAAAIVAGTPEKVKSAVMDAGKRSGKGYQVSEHINNYYRTTKV